jgi:hypothetical protein
VVNFGLSLEDKMAKQKYDWHKVKNEYLMGQITLKDLAIKHAIPEQVLWNRSHKEGWKKQLEETQKKKDVELSSQLQKAAIEIDRGELLDEYKVRSENYQTATIIENRLLKKWENMTDKELAKLSPVETLKGILACGKAKAEAAGLPSHFQVQNNLNVHVGNMETVEEAEDKQSRFAQMAELFQKHLQSQKME